GKPDDNAAQVADRIWSHYLNQALAGGISKCTAGTGCPPEGTYTSDNSSASENILGIEYIPFENSLKDQLIQFAALEQELEGGCGKKL
ncbi:hypothetical protein FRC12_006226, partial [Ceratobasidium sp. 428]